MTEDEAMRAVGYLAGGLSGFGDDAVSMFVEQFIKQDDAAAMEEVCERIALGWRPHEHGGAMRPGIGEVLDAYRKHPRVEAERQASTDRALASDTRGSGRIVSAAEGIQIARDEYRRLYGREMGEAPAPNPDFAEQVIKDLGHFDEHNECWYAHFTDVARAFGGDFHRARLSIQALERNRRLITDSQGRLALRSAVAVPVAAYSPPSLPSAPDGADQPLPPSERPPDPSALLSEALGETARRLEDR